MNTAIQSTIPAGEQVLGQALCACPFSFLGLHKAPNNKGLILRVWRPDADKIAVFEQPSGKNLGEMRRQDSGLFELSLPRRRKLFNYELSVTKSGAQAFRVYDPYQFGEYTLREEHVDYDALYHHQGSHLKLIG